MKNCMNISAMIWPTLSVAKATRHGWLNQGYMVNFGLSGALGGYKPETNTDRPEVRR
jgi:hypothetical protein